MPARRDASTGVGAYAREVLQTGASNAATLTAVQARFPASRANLATMACYRTMLRNEGLLPPAGRTQQAVPATEPLAAAPTDDLEFLFQ